LAISDFSFSSFSLIRSFFSVQRLRRILQIRGVELAQIPRYALFQLLAPPLNFPVSEILVAVIHCLELATIDRNARFRKQTQPPAQLDEARARLLDYALPSIKQRTS
jgi:hypothetical protein